MNVKEHSPDVSSMLRRQQTPTGGNNSHRMGEKRGWRKGGVGKKKKTSLSQNTAQIMFQDF